MKVRRLGPFRGVNWRKIAITLIEDAVRFSCEVTQTATCERETDSLHRNRVRRDAGLSNSLWFLRPSEAWVSAPMVSTLSKNRHFTPLTGLRALGLPFL